MPDAGDALLRCISNFELSHEPNELIRTNSDSSSWVHWIGIKTEVFSLLDRSHSCVGLGNSRCHSGRLDLQDPPPGLGRKSVIAIVPR